MTKPRRGGYPVAVISKQLEPGTGRILHLRGFQDEQWKSEFLRGRMKRSGG